MNSVSGLSARNTDKTLICSSSQIVAVAPADAGRSGAAVRMAMPQLWRLMLLLAAGLFSGCARLTAVPFEPETTPDEWLSQRPFWQFGNDGLVVTEPSSTLLIVGLAAMAAYLGYSQWRGRHNSQARWWFAVGLLLWGVQAALAGTHYQAFSYELLCRGREICGRHSGFEVAYYLVTVMNMNALVVAAAYSSTAGVWRTALHTYAVLNTVVYAAVLLRGVILPDSFLLSFELMVIFTAPNYLLLFVANAWNYRRQGSLLDFRMMQVWILLCAVTAFYFVYADSGAGEWLWQRGIWFNANDALHAALIGWMLFVGWRLLPLLRDYKPRGVGE